MKFSKTFTYTLASLAFTVPAAWLILAGACLTVEDWPQVCRADRIGLSAALLTLGVIVLTLLPIGLIYRERAHRRASRGMWQKAVNTGPGWAAKFERTVKVLWGSEIEPPSSDSLIAGEMRYERRGWYLAVKSGRRVWVDRRELWLWLEKVEALAKDKEKLKPGESAIGERRWQPMLGRDLWLAYMDILTAVGAVEYPTDDVRSRCYVPGLPWSRVEEFEKLNPSERY